MLIFDFGKITSSLRRSASADSLTKLMRNGVIGESPLDVAVKNSGMECFVAAVLAIWEKMGISTKITLIGRTTDG